MTINSKNIPKYALSILKDLHYNGYEAYLVGGCVRDLVLNKEPHDWDMCTNATPEQTLDVLNKNGYRSHTVGIEFGTVTAMCNDEEYEITTYRSEGDYTDSRHPNQLNFETNIHKDLSRRDFTINAMAYEPHTDKLIDNFGGYEDLNKGILRCVGDANTRFAEDPLRIMRALRFAIKYNLSIEDSTKLAMYEHVNKLCNISKERITQELEKMITSGVSVREKFMEFSYIITEIIPQLKPCVEFNQNNKYHTHDVYEHILYVVDYCDTEDFDIKLAALLHDVAKPNSYVEDEEGHGHFYGHPEISYEIAQDILKKQLRLTREHSDMVLKLVRYHDIEIAATKKSVRRAMNNFGIDVLNKWFVLKSADMADHVYPTGSHYLLDIEGIKRIMQELIDESACYKVTDLAINGNDLMRELHMKPCNQIGLILNTLLYEVIDEQIDNDASVLINRAIELNTKDN